MEQMPHPTRHLLPPRCRLLHASGYETYGMWAAGPGPWQLGHMHPSLEQLGLLQAGFGLLSQPRGCWVQAVHCNTHPVPLVLAASRIRGGGRPGGTCEVWW